jgi:HEAT repeat protein
MSMDFSAYLQYAIAECAKVCSNYVPTDVEIKYSQIERTSRTISSLIHKVDRVTVVSGLHRYQNNQLGDKGYGVRGTGDKGHLVLIAKPGMGKSMALRQFHRDLAQSSLNNPQQPIPVLVKLKSYETIPDLICGEFRRAELQITPDRVNQLLAERKLSLLVDGLDEIPARQREGTIRLFRHNHPQVKMIFGTQDLPLSSEFEHKLEMSELTSQQVRSLVEMYLPESAKPLLEQLQQYPSELTPTPFHLKLLCQVFDPATRSIPQNQGELFRAIDAYYINNYINNYNNIDPRNASMGRFWSWSSDILKFLAFSMVRGDDNSRIQWQQRNTPEASRYLHRHEVERLLQQVLPTQITNKEEIANEFLQALLEHHVLQIGDNPDQIEFSHPLFQEYYAAEHVLRQLPNLSDRQLQQDYLNLLKWTQPFVIMLSLLDDRDQALWVVRVALEVDMMLGAKLAIAVKPAFRETTIGWLETLPIPQTLKSPFKSSYGTNSRSETTIYELLQNQSQINNNAVQNLPANENQQTPNESATELLQKLEERNPRVREKAAADLARLGNQEVIAGLRSALYNSRSSVQILAAKTLGQIGNTAAIYPLAITLQNPDAKVRKSAITALLPLLRSLTEEAAPEVISAISNTLQDTDSDIRVNAMFALERLGASIAIPQFVQLLDDTDPKIRSSAISALGRLNAVEVLQGLEDPDSDVRNSAILALAGLSPETLDTTAKISRLLNVLHDPNAKIRKSVITTLGQLVTEAAAPEVISAVSPILQDPDRDVRISAISALARLDAVEVIQGLEDRDPNVRSSAVLALVRLSPEILDTTAKTSCLLNALHDPDAIVGSSVITASERIEITQALQILDPALDHPDANIRKSVISSLERRNTTETILCLLKAMEDPITGKNAVAALKRSKLLPAIPNLIQALEHSQPHVRQNAVNLLKDLDSPEVIPALLSVLSDRDHGVANQAAFTLAKHGYIEAAPRLIAILESSNSYIRHHLRRDAAEALGNLGCTEALPGLIGAVTDHQETYLQTTAAIALGKLGREEAVPYLLPLLETQNPSLISCGGEALGKIGYAPAIPKLVDLADRYDEWPREELGVAAAYTLRTFTTTSAIPELIVALKSSSYVISQSVCLALGEIGAIAIPPLIRALKFPNSSVRAGAASILGQLIPEKVVLEEDDRDVLAEIVPALVAALEDQNFSVMKEVTRSLRKFADLQPLPKLWQQISNSSQDESYPIPTLNAERYKTISIIQNHCGFYSSNFPGAK